MTYVIDANAIIALLNDEPGADAVEKLLAAKNAVAYAHAVNICEVFYNILRTGTEDNAQEALADIRALGIRTSADMDDQFWQDTGRIKAAHRLSLADAFAVALARRVNGELVTSDHHELEPIAQAGVCKINFFR
ncbi:MAG: PIN domain-containing protein [Blastocatellia bacterium]